MIKYDVCVEEFYDDDSSLVIKESFSARDDAILYITENLSDEESLLLVYRTDKPVNIQSSYDRLNDILTEILKKYVYGDIDFDTTIESMLENINCMVDVYSIHDEYTPTSVIYTGIEGYCEFGWGYTDLLNIGKPQPFKIGDIVDTVYSNKRCRCVVMHGESLKECVEKNQYPVRLWKPCYGYNGYEISTGEPVYIIYENDCHRVSTLYEGEVEEYSYLWILREHALGRCETSEDDITAISMGTVKTDCDPRKSYSELPSIKAYIQNHKANKQG